MACIISRFNLAWISAISSSRKLMICVDGQKSTKEMYILTGGLCFPESSCCIAPQKKMIERKMCFAVNMLIAISSQIQANPTIGTAT